MSSVKKIIREAQRNDHTAVFVDITGKVVAIRRLESLPGGIDALKAIGADFPDCALSVYPRGEYTPEQVTARIASAVNGLKLAEAGALKPGANLL